MKLRRFKLLRSSDKRGNAMIEFALSFAILVPVFLGTYEFGYAFYIYNEESISNRGLIVLPGFSATWPSGPTSCVSLTTGPRRSRPTIPGPAQSPSGLLPRPRNRVSFRWTWLLSFRTFSH